MTIYDSIGHDYAKTRVADVRIVQKLLDLLNLPTGSKIIDIGAGTGKYSNALAALGHTVIALEPSEVMCAQFVHHEKVRFIKSSAEQIPLPDNSLDAAIVILALHHFKDRTKAFLEINRVVGTGPIAIFTFDPTTFHKFWLSNYFPKIGQLFNSSILELQNVETELKRVMSKQVTSVEYPLPRDLNDRFGAAMWAHPEAYLNAEIRNGMSDFSLMHVDEVELGLQRLQTDIDSGFWDAAYGSLRDQETCDLGFKFIIVNSK